MSDEEPTTPEETVDKLPTELSNLTVEVTLPPVDKCHRENEVDTPVSNAIVVVNNTPLPLLSDHGLDRWVYELGKHYVFKLDRAGKHGVGRCKPNGCIMEYNVYKYAKPDMRPCLARVYTAGVLPSGHTWCIQRRIPMEVKAKFKKDPYKARTVVRRSWFTTDMHDENYREFNTRAGTHQLVWDFSRSVSGTGQFPGLKDFTHPAEETSLKVSAVEFKVEVQTVAAGSSVCHSFTIDPCTAAWVRIHQSQGEVLVECKRNDAGAWHAEVVDEPHLILKPVVNVWDGRCEIAVDACDTDRLRRVIRDLKAAGRRKRRREPATVERGEGGQVAEEGVCGGDHVPGANDPGGVPEGHVAGGVGEAAPAVGGEGAVGGG